MIALKLPRKANLFYIFQTGYGLASYPIGIFTTFTTIYYLAVNNIPFLKEIFPRFEYFLIVGLLLGLPTFLALGQFYLHSDLNKASTRTHPYSSLLVPTQLPMYQAVADLARLHGLVSQADEIDALVQKSRKKW